MSRRDYAEGDFANAKCKLSSKFEANPFVAFPYSC